MCGINAVGAQGCSCMSTFCHAPLKIAVLLHKTANDSHSLLGTLGHSSFNKAPKGSSEKHEMTPETPRNFKKLGEIQGTPRNSKELQGTLRNSEELPGKDAEELDRCQKKAKVSPSSLLSLTFKELQTCS